MKHVRLTQGTKEIVRWVATGALIYVALGSPIGAGKLTNLLWKKTRKTISSNIRRRLKQMEQAGYITTQGGTIKLTAKGKKQLARISIEDVEIKKERWDHKWRCVAYDIPNSHTKARESFRRTIKNLGFYPIQKSVLVFPYQCEEQVALVARFYHIERYVLIMEANDLPLSRKLKIYFNL